MNSSETSTSRKKPNKTNKNQNGRKEGGANGRGGETREKIRKRLSKEDSSEGSTQVGVVGRNITCIYGCCPSTSTQYQTRAERQMTSEEDSDSSFTQLSVKRRKNRRTEEEVKKYK